LPLQCGACKNALTKYPPFTTSLHSGMPPEYEYTYVQINSPGVPSVDRPLHRGEEKRDQLFVFVAAAPGDRDGADRRFRSDDRHGADRAALGAAHEVIRSSRADRRPGRRCRCLCGKLSSARSRRVPQRWGQCTLIEQCRVSPSMVLSEYECGLRHEWTRHRPA